MIFGILLVAIGAYVIVIHRFLAITKRVVAEVLVVEGWTWDRPGLREAVREIGRGDYQCVICVGESLPRGKAPGGTESSASLAARRLVELGIDKERVFEVTVSDPVGYRTFGAALAVRAWLRHERPAVAGVNVFTIGVHARKSYVLYRKALGPGFQVGIIAGPVYSYSVRRWWASPTGTYAVLRNTVGYLYALTVSAPAETQQ
jgi:hypothetical protein